MMALMNQQQQNKQTAMIWWHWGGTSPQDQELLTKQQAPTTTKQKDKTSSLVSTSETVRLACSTCSMYYCKSITSMNRHHCSKMSHQGLVALVRHKKKYLAGITDSQGSKTCSFHNHHLIWILCGQEWFCLDAQTMNSNSSIPKSSFFSLTF